MFGKCERGRRADGEVVAADVEGVGGFDHFPDLGLFEVGEFVVIGSGEVR